METTAQPVDVGSESADVPLQSAECLDASDEAVLKPAHYKRLKYIFGVGRPAQVVRLEGADVTLLECGLLRRVTRDGRDDSIYISLALTDKGNEVLRQRRAALRKALSIHNDLASRLAAWLRERKNCITWENVTFTRPGPADPDAWSQVRVDVFASAYTPTASLARLEAFEVKRSVSDFRSDLKKPKKSEASLDIAEAAWFVTPAGMIDPSQVPPGFGLLVEDEPGHFTVVRRPKRKKNFVPTPATLMTLVYRRGTLPESAVF